MQAIVLAAGQGTRIRPLSDSVPKPLLPIAGKPMVEHVLAAAADAGADEFVIVTGYEGAQIRDHFGDTFAGHEITYRDQETPNGTAAAVASAGDVLVGDFVVLNGDCLYRPEDLNRLLENGPAMGITEVENPREYGVVSLKNGTVSSIVEKPDDPPTRYANTGAYVLPAETVDLLDVEQSDRGEYELTDAVREVLGRHAVAAIRFDPWMDIAYPWELLEANEALLASQSGRVDGTVEGTARVGDDVIVEAGATVRGGSHVDGPTLIRSGATIGPNAYVRGTTVIGENVTIGHAVEIKNSVIMADAAVPHLSYVGDSILGERVNLGAGTQIANLRHDHEPVNVTVKGERTSTGRRKFGAVLGDDVSTGINTSINPGVTLSAGSVTMPGETVTRDR